MKIKKVMEKNVQKKMFQMIVAYAEEHGLTESNIRKVMDEVEEYMRDNATLQSPR